MKQQAGLSPFLPELLLQRLLLAGDIKLKVDVWLSCRFSLNTG
jgi:hypothetical protein